MPAELLEACEQPVERRVAALRELAEWFGGAKDGEPDPNGKGSPSVRLYDLVAALKTNDERRKALTIVDDIIRRCMPYVNFVDRSHLLATRGHLLGFTRRTEAAADLFLRASRILQDRQYQSWRQAQFLLKAGQLLLQLKRYGNAQRTLIDAITLASPSRFNYVTLAKVLFRNSPSAPFRRAIVAQAIEPLVCALGELESGLPIQLSDRWELPNFNIEDIDPKWAPLLAVVHDRIRDEESTKRSSDEDPHKEVRAGQCSAAIASLIADRAEKADPKAFERVSKRFQSAWCSLENTKRPPVPSQLVKDMLAAARSSYYDVIDSGVCSEENKSSVTRPITIVPKGNETKLARKVLTDDGLSADQVYDEIARMRRGLILEPEDTTSMPDPGDALSDPRLAGVPASLDQLKRQLDHDRACMLAYLICPEGLSILIVPHRGEPWIVRQEFHGGCDPIKTAWESMAVKEYDADTGNPFRSLRTAVEPKRLNPQEGKNLYAKVTEQLTTIARFLLPSELDDVFEQSDLVFVAPPACYLRKIPFHLLPWKGQPLIQKKRLLYLLSPALAEVNEAAAPPVVWYVLANPHLTDEEPLCGPLSVNRWTDSISVEEHLARMAGARSALIVAHGTYDRKVQSRTRCSLRNGGRLHVFDVQSCLSDFDGSEILLIGCNTGRHAPQNRGSESAFITAFLRRGAEAVLACTWEPNVEDGVEFARAYKEHRSTSATRSKSYQHAIKSLLDNCKTPLEGLVRAGPFMMYGRESRIACSPDFPIEMETKMQDTDIHHMRPVSGDDILTAGSPELWQTQQDLDQYLEWINRRLGRRPLFMRASIELPALLDKALLVGDTDLADRLRRDLQVISDELLGHDQTPRKASFEQPVNVSSIEANVPLQAVETEEPTPAVEPASEPASQRRGIRKIDPDPAAVVAFKEQLVPLQNSLLEHALEHEAAWREADQAITPKVRAARFQHRADVCRLQAFRLKAHDAGVVEQIPFLARLPIEVTQILWESGDTWDCAPASLRLEGLTIEQWNVLAEQYERLIVAADALDACLEFEGGAFPESCEQVLRSLIVVPQVIHHLSCLADAETFDRCQSTVFISARECAKRHGIDLDYLRHGAQWDVINRFSQRANSLGQLYERMMATASHTAALYESRDDAVEALGQAVSEPGFGEDHAASAAKLEECCSKLRTSRVPFSDKRVSKLLAPWIQLAWGEPSCEPYLRYAKPVLEKTDVGSTEDPMESADVTVPQELQRARQFFTDKKALIMGPEPDQRKAEQFADALGLASAYWMETKPRQSPDRFRADVEKADLIVVTGHASKTIRDGLKDMAREQNVLHCQLPMSLLNPEVMAQHVAEQLNGRLTGD